MAAPGRSRSRCHSRSSEWRDTPSEAEYQRLVWLGSFGILPRGSLNRPVCRVAEQKRLRADYLRWCSERVEEGQPSEGSAAAEWMSLAQACLPRGPAPAPRTPSPIPLPVLAPYQATSSFYAGSLQTVSHENHLETGEPGQGEPGQVRERE